MQRVLLLGVDGGGTHCRARLATMEGKALGEGLAGPANIRLGLQDAYFSVTTAALQCLRTAGLEQRFLGKIFACLALAGATEPAEAEAARAHPHPFARAFVTSDVHAACVGAHHGRDGGVVVVGTGSIGFAQIESMQVRIGGWGLPLSDEGSGAWLGSEALRRVLWAHDGRIEWTALLQEIASRFAHDPHAVARYSHAARPADFGRLAPLVVAHAAQGDEISLALMQQAGGHLDALVRGLRSLGAPRIAVVGGLSQAVGGYASECKEGRVVEPKGDALQGALLLARQMVDQPAHTAIHT